jgi:flagellar biosynthesis protein FlhF
MADVRTFRAASMREALDLVREELGADAVILHTRQVARRRFLPWRKPLDEVEITASLTFEAAPREERTPRKRTQPTASQPTGSKPGAPKPSPPKSPTAKPASRGPAARSGGAGSVGSRLDLTSEPTETLEDLLSRSATIARIAASRAPQAPNRRLPKDAPPAESNEQRRPFEALEPAGRLNRFTGRPIGINPASADESDPTAALSRRLDSIQQMLHDLGRANHARQDQVPPELFQVYTELIDAEVEDDVARDLIYKLKRNATPAQLGDADAARALLTALVESEIRCREPIAAKPGRRRVVALVGATGVGKTTTIAKLAANFRLRSGVKLGLVTVDTYRVAAVEQLRTYAEIIDLPMKVVTNPLEMRRALDELAGLDLVLIDTAGRSPKDELQIQELKSLLAEAHVDEVHLVLSMTSSRQSLEAAADKFQAAGTTAVILTKLDEASGVGAILSLARRVELPISYLTAGQAVPDDIEPAHPRRIARMILGQERAVK